MKTLFLDCSMGAAGDMLTAALLELQEDRDEALELLNAMGVPGVTFAAHPEIKGGITGTHLHVTVAGDEELPGGFVHHHEPEQHTHEHAHNHDHDHAHTHMHPHMTDVHLHGDNHEHMHFHEHTHTHAHSSLHDIDHLIDHLHVSDTVKANAKAVYALIAQAESRVHGEPISDIHFHEVGTLDAVADVAAVCLLLERLHVDCIAATPVHVGSGTVRCAHGILPVPAPATALLLQGIPTYGGEVKGELCTPTGAALLRRFVQSFGSQPLMQTEKIGYGLGTKDFPEAPNCVRAMLGTAEEHAADEIVSLETNLDDMSPEWIAFACERLLEAGAKDVYTTAIQMKKGRPAVKLTVLCAPQDKEKMTKLLFCHTTTLGVREMTMQRSVLRRQTETRETAFGTVRFKCSAGFDTKKEKPEFEDLARIARENDLSLFEVVEQI